MSDAAGAEVATGSSEDGGSWPELELARRQLHPSAGVARSGTRRRTVSMSVSFKLDRDQNVPACSLSAAGLAADCTARTRYGIESIERAQT